MNLTCTGCGEEIETLPLKCAHSISIDKETNQMECYMENCGTISIDEFMCESCCTKRNIMKIAKAFEQLSLENEEFKEELTYFKKTVIQTNTPNSDFKFWVEFGNGIFVCDKGARENPLATLNCSQETMNQILEGKTEAYNEFFSGNVKIEGDLQYAVVFLDLIKLASEIIKETGGVSIE